MTDFSPFAKIVAKSFQKMERVFQTDLTPEELWETYLASFPEGTNPIFRERTEHDCNCCSQFVKRVGNAVSIANNGDIATVWSDAAKKAEYPYNEVAAAMDAKVRSVEIVDIFCTKETYYGKERTESLSSSTGKVERWNHFYTGPLTGELFSTTPEAVRGRVREAVALNKRGLTEIDPDAVDTVLELIDSKSLYRGEEHKSAVSKFRTAQRKFKKLGAKKQVAHLWTASNGPNSRFRNSVIGTLLVDLSKGVDVTTAVASFESKVAPQNYKRTSAVITPGMVKKAMETINTLGLEPALERRFARLEDIAVNDVLWVNSGAAPMMKGGALEGTLLAVAARQAPKKQGDTKDAEQISIDKFLADVMPKAEHMELLLKGKHTQNLMALTAPIHPEPKQLFQWDNDFAWSYDGNITDSSIRTRVKNAGGNVTNAVLRISLAWTNLDDLDIQVRSPKSKISYQRKNGLCGGQLDIDMNVGNPVRDAVENVSWASMPPDGEYAVAVHNYTPREKDFPGFTIEVESQGVVTQYHYPKKVMGLVHVLKVTMKNGAIERVHSVNRDVTSDQISQEKWGLTTETFVKVNAVSLSPNHWGENKVGNKHTFFVLDGAENDEPTRGIYNEFLHPRLVEHRKVFEIIGEKTKCQPTEGQLSGVGFSSTKKDSVIVKVMTGQKQRLYNVQVGV